MMPSIAFYNNARNYNVSECSSRKMVHAWIKISFSKFRLCYFWTLVELNMTKTNERSFRYKKNLEKAK